MSKAKASKKANRKSAPKLAQTAGSFKERMTLCSQQAKSVSALAKKAGISQSGIRRYFSGGEPTRPHLIALASAAGVSLNWLATGEGNPNNRGEAAGQQLVKTLRETDLALLEQVACVAFEELQRRKLCPEPAEQARLLCVLYRHFASKDEPLNRDIVKNIVNLVDHRQS